MDNELPIAGTKQEQRLFTDVFRHYVMAKEDLATRIIDFDKKDILFRSHIDEKNWPYRSLIFDPRVFTAIFEKTSRILANKPRGRMVPRESGDALGARINNELLSFQWDDNDRADNNPMLAKWAMMDLNARKYGASFGLAKWKYERQVKRSVNKKEKPVSSVYFDGPNFKPLENRDCLPNPSYSTIKNWFQHREYVTFQELENCNDASRTEPAKYINLEELKERLRLESKKGGDRRDSNYTVKNLSIKGLTDYLGQDEVFKTIEIVTEYRQDRWITFSPKHGVILRDIPNPYDHGQIPVVMLKYYPIDDDLYGLSEIEPVEKLQKATNALICQYMDAVNMSLYAPLKVNQTGGSVQMHTLEFGPGKKWLMNDPSKDVMTHDQNITGVSEFTSTYRFLISAMQEALGETSAGVSNLNPGQEGKTATEVKDLAISRSARDNYNQIFLSEALKKQMMFWFKMNQQMLFSDPTEQQKVIRIVGKDAIAYFQGEGLDQMGLNEEGEAMLADPAMAGIAVPDDLQTPMYPVSVGDEVIPKFMMENDGQTGHMIVEPDDLSGEYDYIPDIESMQLPDNNQLIAANSRMIELSLNPVTQQTLMQEGYKLKMKDLLEDTFELLGKKDADKYFEKLQQDPMMGGINGQQIGGVPVNQAGAGAPQAGPEGMVNGQLGGVQGAVPAMA